MIQTLKQNKKIFYLIPMMNLLEKILRKGKKMLNNDGVLELEKIYI